MDKQLKVQQFDKELNVMQFNKRQQKKTRSLDPGACVLAITAITTFAFFSLFAYALMKGVI